MTIKMTIAELHEVVLRSAAEHDLLLNKRQAYLVARDIVRYQTRIEGYAKATLCGYCGLHPTAGPNNPDGRCPSDRRRIQKEIK